MVEAAFESWKLNPWIIAFLVGMACLYVRGWRSLHQQMPHRFGELRLVSYMVGLVVVFLAMASPLDAFAGWLLTVHMVQHLLLMMVAPPLLVLGAPYLPFLRGLPSGVLKHGLGPFLAWPALQRFGRALTHPIVCWLSFVLASVFWHVPIFYELALHSPFWHEVEHVCFLSTGILFWWPVIQPWPSQPHWPRWTMIPYLFLADFQNTALAGFLSFYERVIYPTYAAAPRIFNFSALEDQATAGLIMWVPGSLAYLIPVGWLTILLLSGRRSVRPSDFRNQSPEKKALQIAKTKQRTWDLLKVPLLGKIIGWGHFRRAMQTVLLFLAIAMIIDGLLGNQMSPMNLAGILPWTYWRGLLVILLLAAGNFFCMACPFMLTRNLGRRFLPARWRWPRRLRSKWLAVGLLSLYLWAYEAFSLWDSPWWTAWIVIAYFLTAFMVDGFFRGASFCKYVCPVGQFNFVQSMVSPLEVKIHDLEVCHACSSYDCIRGNAIQRGCELHLFQPKKSSNLDCTFCLDCVHACPQDNVGILLTVPGSQLVEDKYRSGIGRLSRRLDVAVLILVLVFGAFANAAGMVSPVASWEHALQLKIGLGSRLPVVSFFLVLALLIVPALSTVVCIVLSRLLGKIKARWQELACSFVITFVPLGFSMWLAHFGYHLLLGYRTLVPVTQRVAQGWGIQWLGSPQWVSASMIPSAEGLLSIQIIFLDCGLLLSLYLGWRVALRFAARAKSSVGLFVPWASLVVSLYLIGVWISFQPMEMRGMMVH